MIKRELPWFQKMMVLLNGIFGALIILGLILVFFIRVVGYVSEELDKIDSFNADIKIEKGIIVEKIEPEGENKIFIYEFVLTDHNIVEKWESFSEMNLQYFLGQEVEVETDVNDAEKKRIKYMQHKPPQDWLVAIFGILMCFVGIGYNLFKGYKIYKLVTYGKLTRAKVVDIQETNIEINDNPLYKVYLSFTNINSEKCIIMIKSTRVGHLVKNTKHDLFYNIDNNQKGVLLEQVPFFVKRYIRTHWIKDNNRFGPNRY